MKLAINTIIFALISFVSYKVYLYFNLTKVNETVRFKESNQPHIKWTEEDQRRVRASRAFTEVQSFPESTFHWSSVYTSLSAGILVFDANNDGKLDVYFPQDGLSKIRPTDKDGVLLEKPYPQVNELFINRGNNNDGTPIFESVSNSSSKNDSYQKEELLIENLLFPRNSTDEQFDVNERRQSNVAIAADFNGDGLVDILVGNGVFGSTWSHPKTQRTLPKFVSPITKSTRKSQDKFTSFIQEMLPNYKAKDSTKERVASSKGVTFIGANTLFLNQGDRDNDGIPEWKEVANEVGISGRRNTYSLTVADIDLDGDLDVFEGNVPDLDYWPGASSYWAGAFDRLYINQLSETGEFRFVESSESFGVSGKITEEDPMPKFLQFKFTKNSILSNQVETREFIPRLLELNGDPTEPARFTWAAIFQDYNNDGFPDLWVARDFDKLTLYKNIEGKKFEIVPNSRSELKGSWMSFAPADFNGDGFEDLFVGNIGGSDPQIILDLGEFANNSEPNLLDLMFVGNADRYHWILDGRDPKKAIFPKIKYSKVLPPSLRWGSYYLKDYIFYNPKNRLSEYEFSWGSTVFDIQNDGRPDFYFHGSIFGRGGHGLSAFGTNPGRLLVNTSQHGVTSFQELTAEHHLFNIEELDYTKLEKYGYISRPAPNTNWNKRHIVYSYDQSYWTFDGSKNWQRALYDLAFTAENGKGAISADLNGDGYEDLILRNTGGYDSNSSSSKNLKVQMEGKIRALPSHNYNTLPPTNYEPGKTRTFINNYKDNNWIKVSLIDKNSHNRFAIGAKVTINKTMTQVIRAESGSFVSNKFSPLVFGLKDSAVESVTVTWPDKKQTTKTYKFKKVRNSLITIEK